MMRLFRYGLKFSHDLHKKMLKFIFVARRGHFNSYRAQQQYFVMKLILVIVDSGKIRVRGERWMKSRLGEKYDAVGL